MEESTLPSGKEWTKYVLRRSLDQSQQVLDRAKQRQVQWPKQDQGYKNPIQDPAVYTSIDDAFGNILQYLSTTSRQCKRYYRSCDPNTKSTGDDFHCDRFHTPQFTALQHKNPLQGAESVHLVVQPGTYAVTAGSWGTQQQQTHVVHVDQGQSVDLDFVM